MTWSGLNADFPPSVPGAQTGGSRSWASLTCWPRGPARGTRVRMAGGHVCAGWWARRDAVMEQGPRTPTPRPGLPRKPRLCRTLRPRSPRLQPPDGHMHLPGNLWHFLCTAGGGRPGGPEWNRGQLGRRAGCCCGPSLRVCTCVCVCLLVGRCTCLHVCVRVHTCPRMCTRVHTRVSAPLSCVRVGTCVCASACACAPTACDARPPHLRGSPRSRRPRRAGPGARSALTAVP